LPLPSHSWWFKLQKFLFVFARSPLARGMIGWLFTHMSFAIPVQRLRETPTLLAFHHPKPGYAVHILLVPKRSIASLTELKPEDSAFTVDLFQTVQSLVAELGLETHGYRLICNGGAYQDVPILHFHLVSGDTLP
jgi:histidine triad (HIT) family protein